MHAPAPRSRRAIRPTTFAVLGRVTTIAAAAAAATSATMAPAAPAAAPAAPPPAIGTVEVSRSPEVLAAVVAGDEARGTSLHGRPRPDPRVRSDPWTHAGLPGPQVLDDPDAPIADRIRAATILATEDPTFRLPVGFAPLAADYIRSFPTSDVNGLELIGTLALQPSIDAPEIRDAILDRMDPPDLHDGARGGNEDGDGDGKVLDPTQIAVFTMHIAMSGGIPGAREKVQAIAEDPDHPLHRLAAALVVQDVGEAGPEYFRPALDTIDAQPLEVPTRGQVIWPPELDLSALENASEAGRDLLCERLPRIVDRILDLDRLPGDPIVDFLIAYGDARCWGVLERLARTRYSFPGLEVALVRIDPLSSVDLAVELIADSEYRSNRAYRLARLAAPHDREGRILASYRPVVERALVLSESNDRAARAELRALGSQVRSAMLVAAHARHADGRALIRRALELPRDVTSLDWRTLRLALRNVTFDEFRRELDGMGWSIGDRRQISDSTPPFFSDLMTAHLSRTGRLVKVDSKTRGPFGHDRYLSLVANLASCIPGDAGLELGAVTSERLPSPGAADPEADAGALVRFVIDDVVYSIRTWPHPDQNTPLDVAAVQAAFDRVLTDAGRAERIRFLGSPRTLAALTPDEATVLSERWLLDSAVDPDEAGPLDGRDRGPAEFDRYRRITLAELDALDD